MARKIMKERSLADVSSFVTNSYLKRVKVIIIMTEKLKEKLKERRRTEEDKRVKERLLIPPLKLARDRLRQEFVNSFLLIFSS